MASSNKNSRIGIYAGTFDPITNGHLDIIKKSLNIVDILHIAIAEDTLKRTLFSSKERLAMVRQEIIDNNLPSDRINIQTFSGLLVNHANLHNVTIIIRGMRTVSDYDYEFQMACINKMLNCNMQTIFIPAAQELQFVSSSFAKEIIKLNGDAKYFLSSKIKTLLANKLKE